MGNCFSFRRRRGCKRIARAAYRTSHERTSVARQNKDPRIYSPGEKEKHGWLATVSALAASGPKKFPYYLLVIGSPEKIPFSFRHQLGVEYGVGSLHFDSADEYSRYVRSLIDYEKREDDSYCERSAFLRRPSSIRSGNANERRSFSKTTYRRWQRRSAGQRQIRDFKPKNFGRGCDQNRANGAHSRRRQKQKPPSFLFTASTAWDFPRDIRIKSAGRALLCQDWPGFGAVRPGIIIFRRLIFLRKARVHGMITFHFACYGAGTPAHDRFIHEPGSPPPEIAPQSFIAALPTGVAHSSGRWSARLYRTCRARVGLLDCHFKSGRSVLPFENAIGRILKGEPVGLAMKDFYERYASLSVSLSSMLEELSFGASVG